MALPQCFHGNFRIAQFNLFMHSSLTNQNLGNLMVSIDHWPHQNFAQQITAAQPTIEHIVGKVGHLTIILGNRAEYRLIFQKIGQDNGLTLSLLTAPCPKLINIRKLQPE